MDNKHPTRTSKRIEQQYRTDKFHQYMLAELQQTLAYGQDMSTRQGQSMQFYLAAITVIIGGGTALVARLDSLGALAVVGLIFLLIGVVGTQTVVQNSWYHEMQMRQMAIWASLQSYFRDFDPDAFERYGQQAILEGRLKPHYFMEFSRAPWKQFVLVGAFAVAHSGVLAVGIGILSGTLLESFSGPPRLEDWLMIAISVISAEITFHIHLYLMARVVRERHIKAREYTQSVLKNILGQQQQPENCARNLSR